MSGCPFGFHSHPDVAEGKAATDTLKGGPQKAKEAGKCPFSVSDPKNILFLTYICSSLQHISAQT
jgi:hypothetical protein